MVAKTAYDHNRALQDVAAVRGQLNNLQAALALWPQTDALAVPTVVTAATFQNLTAQFPILANNANTKTIYRLSAWGDLNTPASALQACRWAISAFGLTAGAGAAMCSVAASNLSASLSYEWKVEAVVVIVASGASGTAHNWINGTISQFEGSPSAPINDSSANSIALTGGAGNTTIDTTVDTTFGLQSEWAVVETGQQVRYFGGMLERLGP